MASPPATGLCTASSFGLPPHVVLLWFLAALLLAAPQPTGSSSSSDGADLQPTLTFCSGQTPAITGVDLANFLDAVCAGAYGVAHMSHNMSMYVAAEKRTMYGVAQCRPDVTMPDCIACLAASSRHIGRTACAASAVWHDACFLRYSDRDPGHFREDEYTKTVFNASHALSSPPHEEGKAVVRRLLAAVGSGTMSSHMCRGVGAGTGTSAGRLIYGLTRCAAGISCDDCLRCLRARGGLDGVQRQRGDAGPSAQLHGPVRELSLLQRNIPATGRLRFAWWSLFHYFKQWWDSTGSGCATDPGAPWWSYPTTSSCSCQISRDQRSPDRRFHRDGGWCLYGMVLAGPRADNVTMRLIEGVCLPTMARGLIFTAPMINFPQESRTPSKIRLFLDSHKRHGTKRVTTSFTLAGRCILSQIFQRKASVCLISGHSQLGPITPNFVQNRKM